MTAEPGRTEIDELRALCATVASGAAVLFTGAGFAAGARDLGGEPLPDSKQMRAELWALLFDDAAEPDDSTLQDLYDVALERIPARLDHYLGRRLRVGSWPLPSHYAIWLAAPWQRVYTLNVDDLELAVQRRFALPRRLRAQTSAMVAEPDDPSALTVVHLNGLAADGARSLTFSTLQYAARLCDRDRDYAALVQDMAAAPFVFAGTTLDEIVMWQHLELHRLQAGGHGSRPPSWLITPSLSRARRLLLEDIGVRWIATTVEAAAPHLANALAPVLGRLGS